MQLPNHMVAALTVSKVTPKWRTQFWGISRKTKQVYRSWVTLTSFLLQIGRIELTPRSLTYYRSQPQSLDPLHSPWFFQHQRSHHSLPSRSESWPAGALILWFPLASSCWYPSTHRNPHSSYPHWKSHAYHQGRLDSHKRLEFVILFAHPRMGSGSSSCPDVYRWLTFGWWVWLE